MYGLTDRELNTYRERAVEYARTDVIDSVLNYSQFLTPLIQEDEDKEPRASIGFIQGILGDIETIIVLTTSMVIHDYAEEQVEGEKTEKEIIDFLHEKYMGYVVSAFISYGIVFTEDIVQDIVGNLILELPYLYSSAIEDGNFDENEFLEEKMEAYNDYLIDNFPPEEGEM